MKKVWRLLVRVIFWSYERGSLPYDVMVIVILLFVLLTPRSWFHDRPKPGEASVAGQIRLLEVETASDTEVFRVDAALIAPPQPGRGLEQETHNLLGRSVSSLRGEDFKVVQVQPVHAPDGTLTGYNVRIKPAARPSR